MRRRAIRQSTQAVLQRHAIPDELSLSDLTSRLEQLRGHRVRFAHLNGQQVHGLWLGDRAAKTDIVLLPEASTPASRFAIATHELGHMLAVPPGEEEPFGQHHAVEAELAGLIPVDRRIDYAYGRTGFSQDDEQLAESIGAELAIRVLRWERSRAARTYRFEQVFG